MNERKLANHIRESINTMAVSWYLEYVNDYLTIEKFAEHKGISVKAAETVIADGKRINEKRSK